MAKKESKAPVNTPKVGSRVRLRGRQATGLLTKVDARKWADVTWEADAAGPKIVHLFELEAI